MRVLNSLLIACFVCVALYSSWNVNVRASSEVVEDETMPTVDADVRPGSPGTDDEVVEREEEQIKLDGMNVAQMKEMREKADKHEFVAEVTRMMKLIINSLYKNKEIFLRELISNASDALDKIRFLSVTDKNVLGETDSLDIRIKADKDNRMLHITDSGIGMTRDDLTKYLGTIAKSQTNEFLTKFEDAQTSENRNTMNDLIGQFGVGFYSAFLVADKVIVTSKHNDDEHQHVWESDSQSFTVSRDPRGNTLGRGTTVSLYLKEDALDFLEESKLREVVKKYSQFINFNIYLWSKKITQEDAPETPKEEKEASEEGEVSVEKEEEEKPKEKKKIDKTTWSWEMMNQAKPIWQRKPSEITESEYNEFYKSFVVDRRDPLEYTHFVAEGEVTFKALLFVPRKAPGDLFSNYNSNHNSIKMYVRRVFITEAYDELLPRYLASFVRGVVDSDDLPLNVSRETLQQNKLMRVIKKKLVRKVLDMIKKMSDEDYAIFWKEFGTNMKLGVIDDNTNRIRLAKLLRFGSSQTDLKGFTSLQKYVERMKPQQENIYYIAGASREELAKSPFVERLLKKGYEVLYLTDPVDEYCMQTLAEFEGKKLQSLAKDGLNIDQSKKSEERLKELKQQFEPLVQWMKDGPLKDLVEDIKISTRLVKTPMALLANQYGLSGNLERIQRAQAYQKSGGDRNTQHYYEQKKILEINPGHPLLKELLRRVEGDPSDQKALDMTNLMYEAATLRSGYELKDMPSFADRIDTMLRSALDIPLDEGVEEEVDIEEEPAAAPEADAAQEDANEEEEVASEAHEEL